MTQQTALETLIHLDNRRSYSVAVNETRVVHEIREPHTYTRATITIFAPGDSSSAAVEKQITTPSLSEGMALAVAFIKSELPTA